MTSTDKNFAIFKDKRVLVTGHTGFKGSWLSEWLLKLGAKVCGYSLYIPSEPSMFEVLGLSSKLKHVVGDINDFEMMKKTFQDFQPEVVFHLAAQPIVSTSLQQAPLTFQTNLMGTVNVLELVKSFDCVKAAVFITSDKCYENVEWEYGYRETDAVGGKDPYSASKACAEIAFHSYYRSFFTDLKRVKIATGRAGNVIGGGDWAKDRIVPDCMRTWGSSPAKAAVIRSPKATRPWQHVLEPLSGYLRLGEALLKGEERINGESFNFGPPAETNASVERLLEELVKTWRGKTWNVESSQLARKEAGLLRLNCDKAQNRLDWSPTLDFAEAAGITAEWYQAFYEGNAAKARDLTSSQIDLYIAKATERRKGWTHD